MKEEIRYINKDGYVYEDKEACILSELESDVDKIAYGLKEIFGDKFPVGHMFIGEASKLEQILKKGHVISDEY